MSTTLPPALVAFRDDLEAAARRDLAARTPRRRRAARLGLAGAAAAATAFLVIAGLPAGEGPSAIARAAAALDPPGAGILHVVEVRTSADGTTQRMEGWYGVEGGRQAVTGADGGAYELGWTTERSAMYDPARNTIYVAPPELGKPGVSPKAGAKEGIVESYRSKLEALLRSGKLREDGREPVEGREAIRMVSADGQNVYLVDAQTFAPLEWRSPTVGDSIRYEAWEEVPAGTPLALEDAHPDARVETGERAYRDAVERYAGSPMPTR
jgi:hypothetical protein